MISTHKGIHSNELSSFHQTCFLILLFLQGRKSSQLCPFVDWLIHSINPYQVPYLPSIGLGVGIYRWVIHVSIFEGYTKRREVHAATYRWILWGMVCAEKDKFIWFWWHRGEEDGSSIHLRASEDPKEDLVIGFIREIINQFKYSAIKYSVKWLKFKSTFWYTHGTEISGLFFLPLALKWQCSGCCSGLPKPPLGQLFPHLLRVLAAALFTAESLSGNCPWLGGADFLQQMWGYRGLAPLPQCKTTLKGHLSCGAPCRIDWGLCCDCISVQLLPPSNPASFTFLLVLNPDKASICKSGSEASCHRP